MSRDPFLTGTNRTTGEPIGAVDATSRIDMAKRFTRDECMAALDLPDLQVTVIAAVSKRLRFLEANKFADLLAGRSVQRSGTG